MVTTNTATPSPEAQGAGAVAHMSLHLKPTMSKNTTKTKNPDKLPSPRFLRLGRELAARPMLATVAKPCGPLR